MNYEIKQQDKFKFISRRGEPLLLLHGLFGAMSNFKDTVEYFRTRYKVVVPILPLFDWIFSYFRWRIGKTCTEICGDPRV